MAARERIMELYSELGIDKVIKADTVAGEIVRAVVWINRYYSDPGFHIGVGLGAGACDPPARYLVANAGQEVGQIIEAMWGVKDDIRYKSLLESLHEAVVAYLDRNPNLKNEKNHEDVWTYELAEDFLMEHEEDIKAKKLKAQIRLMQYSINRLRWENEALKQQPVFQQKNDALKQQPFSFNDLCEIYDLLTDRVLKLDEEAEHEADLIVEAADHPESDAFQNAVKAHRTAKAHLKYYGDLLLRISALKRKGQQEAAE